MRRQIIVVFCTLILMAFGATAAERGALYQVSANGHTLHLFGTMHIGRPDFFPLEPKIRAAMAAAPTLAVEIDLERDPAAIAKAMQTHGTFAPGSAGYAGLAPERRARIEGALKKVGIDPAGVGQFKPWVLTAMLGVMEAMKLGYRLELGIDQHLLQLAHGSKAKVVELESMDYQLALFERLTVDEQWRMLEESLAYIESGRNARETREMLEAYNSADDAALDAIAARVETDPDVSAKFVRELLLGERNGPMADKVAALLARENNAVVAVGVLHLVGKRGLPELLRARGIKVERVY
ncbi:MAG TPA: TraB/GumN family protein [Telluria sp.]